MIRTRDQEWFATCTLFRDQKKDLKKAITWRHVERKTYRKVDHLLFGKLII